MKEKMTINDDMKEQRKEIELFGDYKKFYEKFMDYIDRGGRGIQAELSRSTGINYENGDKLTYLVSIMPSDGNRVIAYVYNVVDFQP